METRRLGGLVASVGLLIFFSVLTGCSSGPGSPFSLFSGVNRLSTNAKDLRETSGPPPAMPRELDKQVAGPYIVEPGDVLLVQAANLDSPLRLPGDQPVLPDGTIHLGKFGHLVVAGKPLITIEAEVNAFIKAKVAKAGDVVVRLATRDSKVYYVLGEVNAPGVFPLRGRETVLDAIVTAGGLNTNASRKKIILSRPTAPDSCRIVLPVNYNAIVQVGDTTTNYQIRAGDRVFVPTKGTFEDFCNKKNNCRCQTTCYPREGCSPDFPARPGLPPPDAPAALGLPVEGAIPHENGPALPDSFHDPLPAPKPVTPSVGYRPAQRPAT